MCAEIGNLYIVAAAVLTPMLHSNAKVQRWISRDGSEHPLNGPDNRRGPIRTMLHVWLPQMWWGSSRGCSRSRVRTACRAMARNPLRAFRARGPNIDAIGLDSRSALLGQVLVAMLRVPGPAGDTKLHPGCAQYGSTLLMAVSALFSGSYNTFLAAVHRMCICLARWRPFVRYHRFQFVASTTGLARATVKLAPRWMRMITAGMTKATLRLAR